MSPKLNCSQLHLKMLPKEELFKLIAQGEMDHAWDNILLSILCKDESELADEDLTFVVLLGLLRNTEKLYRQNMISFQEYNLNSSKINCELTRIVNHRTLVLK